MMSMFSFFYSIFLAYALYHIKFNCIDKKTKFTKNSQKNQHNVLTSAKKGYNIYKDQQSNIMSAKRGEKMLDDRKKKVLKAIVEEYINTAEPVGSVALTQNEDLKYSSATIRNEMADLEKAGYLEKTHTSSGRIPSEKGYRYYVDELLKDDNISLEEIKYISDKLETKANEIEDLTKIATTTISEITHYTTLAIGPSTQDLLIEEIKFVLLGPRMLMAIILTNTGMVKETIIKFDEDITDKQVETINYMFNKKLNIFWIQYTYVGFFYYFYNILVINIPIV